MKPNPIMHKSFTFPWQEAGDWEALVCLDGSQCEPTPGTLELSPAMDPSCSSLHAQVPSWEEQAPLVAPWCAPGAWEHPLHVWVQP